ncbi:hypothetical protein SprV_0200703700 [Sparganum proliferum]
MRRARDRQRESLTLSGPNPVKSVAKITLLRSFSKRGHEIPPLLNDNEIFLIDVTDKAELLSAFFRKHLITESEPVPFFRSLSNRALSTIGVSSDLIKKHINPADGVLLYDGSNVVRSVGAVVSLLLGADPLSCPLAELLLWESGIFRVAWESSKSFLPRFQNPSTSAAKPTTKASQVGRKTKEKSTKTLPQAAQSANHDTDELERLQVEVTPEEMLKAEWNFSSRFDVKPLLEVQAELKKSKHPAKKDAGIRNVLITSALPYVNNVPHLGNLIGSLLSANIFSIYCELAGYNVLSICGTDEYGTAIEAKSQSEGLSPSQVADKYSALHQKVYDWFDIHFDYFGRTSTPKHTEITQEAFTRLNSNGYITEASIEQLFCEKCARALADRLVEGICPFCNADGARGDQCDACGKLINAIELIQPRCSTCGTTPVIQSSDHLFLDLPKLEGQVTSFFEQRINDPSANWTPVAQGISRAWLRDGLKQRCITRDLKWGVPVPLEKFRNKVFYVWFDAPIGYLSITANYTPDWRLWWQPPTDVAPIEYFQFMAKDNVPFHAAIFPACLLGINEGYTMVKNLIAIDYLNYEGKKFSKSRSIGVFGDNAKETGIASNIWRFYLAYIRPENQDSTFSWEDFATKNNSELLNNLGNFINRPLNFVAKFFSSVIPNMMKMEPDDVTFLARVNGILKKYLTCMEQCQLRDGLRHVLSISRLGNGYFQTQQPWVLFKTADTVERAGVVTGIACNIAALLGVLIRPFMPSFSDEIFKQCNLPPELRSLIPLVRNDGHTVCFLPQGHVIGQPAPLFKRIEPEDVERFRKMYSSG